jgi:hypothetical protein
MAIKNINSILSKVQEARQQIDLENRRNINFGRDTGHTRHALKLLDYIISECSDIEFEEAISK